MAVILFIPFRYFLRLGPAGTSGCSFFDSCLSMVGKVACSTGFAGSENLGGFIQLVLQNINFGLEGFARFGKALAMVCTP